AAAELARARGDRLAPGGGRGAREDRPRRLDACRGAEARRLRCPRGSASMRREPASAKLNLALVVRRPPQDRQHEVATVYQRLDLAGRVAVWPAPHLRVGGFAADPLVRRALERLADAAGVAPAWKASLTKRIPVASGLGGGSSDAATALRLANQTLDSPLPATRLRELASELGADVPFFLTQGPQLGLGDGTELTPPDLPQHYS